jgi:hypothetical protein
MGVRLGGSQSIITRTPLLLVTGVEGAPGTMEAKMLIVVEFVLRPTIFLD